MLKFTHLNGDSNKSGYLETDIKCCYHQVNSQSALHLILKTRRGGNLAWHSSHLFSDLCIYLLNFKEPNNKRWVLAVNNAAISSIFLWFGGFFGSCSLQTGWTVPPVPMTAAPMGNALQSAPAPLTTFHRNITELLEFSQRHLPHLHRSLELLFQASFPSKLWSLFPFQGAQRESRAPRSRFIAGCVLKAKIFLMFSRLYIKYVSMRLTGTDAITGSQTGIQLCWAPWKVLS